MTVLSYALCIIGGLLVGYMLAVALPDTAVDTATKRANAKFTIPVSIAIVMMLVIMGYLMVTVGDLSFKLDAATQALDILKGGGSPVVPTR